MRKTSILLAVAAMILAAGILGRLARLSAQSGAEPAQSGDESAKLPAVFRPANTPTPQPSPTLLPTPTDGPHPPPPPTVTPWPSPTPGFGANALENGSFEGDQNWTNLPPVPGNLINQQPNGWLLDWVEPGEWLWDPRTGDPERGIATGIAEMIHKNTQTLPPNEWMGGPDALILEGTQTYKMFHKGAVFGSQLSQEVTLPAGSWRLTVPVQLHWHENLDPADPTWDTYTAESGAWLLTNTGQAGGWANARDMGDRRWFYHVIEFTLATQTDVQVLIRVKSIYKGPKDFFVDAVWLQPVATVSQGVNGQGGDGRMLSTLRLLESIPAAERVSP